MFDAPLTIFVTGQNISRLQIGAGGTGTASFLPGTEISFDTSGSAGGYGTLDVGRGADSAGEVNHSGGLVDLNGGAFQIGVEGGTGTYALSGSATVAANLLMVGEGTGVGHLTIQGAAQLTVGTEAAPTGHVFVGTGGTGTIAQDGEDSVVSFFAENGVFFGREKETNASGEYHLVAGTLTIGSFNGVYFGNQSGTEGHYTQDGGTSNFRSNVSVGDRGTGEFTINGGTATVEGELMLAHRVAER